MAEITEIEKARIATNDPDLSDIQVTVGDREFTIVDLPYREYVKFLAYLHPLLETVAGRVAGVTMDPALVGAGLMKYCLESLPEMASICLRQTDPSMTPDAVMLLAKSPFRLTSVVMAQMKRNNALQDVIDFFKQMLPLIKIGQAALGASTVKTIR